MHAHDCNESSTSHKDAFLRLKTAKLFLYLCVLGVSDSTCFERVFCVHVCQHNSGYSWSRWQTWNTRRERTQGEGCDLPLRFWLPLFFFLLYQPLPCYPAIFSPLCLPAKFFMLLCRLHASAPLQWPPMLDDDKHL